MDQGPIRPLPESGTQASSGFAARPVVRGPAQGVLKRVVMLCLKPEAWADMARYPLRYTVWTVVVAVILASLLTAIAAGRLFVHELSTFASHYDTQFAPMTFAEGKLSARADTPKAKMPRYEIRNSLVIADPTGQTHVDEMPDGSVLIGSDAIYTKYPWGTFRDPSLYEALKTLGTKSEINGVVLKQITADLGGPIATIWAGAMFIFSLGINALWAVIIAFLVSPLVRIAAPNLRMPRGMSYRISGAITVPLLMLSGVLELVGHPPRAALGSEGATLFWFFVAAGLALWGGYLLNRHAMEALQRTRGK